MKHVVNLSGGVSVDRECIRILEALLEQRRQHAHCQWEHEFQTLDGLITRIDSPAMRTLLAQRLVQYYPSTSNEDIPDDAVRIAAGRVDDVEAIVAVYVAGLERVTRPLLSGGH